MERAPHFESMGGLSFGFLSGASCLEQFGKMHQQMEPVPERRSWGAPRRAEGGPCHRAQVPNFRPRERSQESAVKGRALPAAERLLHACGE